MFGIHCTFQSLERVHWKLCSAPVDALYKYLHSSPYCEYETLPLKKGQKLALLKRILEFCQNKAISLALFFTGHKT